MGNNSEAGKETARRMMASNPNYFRDISLKAKKPRGGKNSPGSFDPERARLAGVKSGIVRRAKRLDGISAPEPKVED